MYKLKLISEDGTCFSVGNTEQELIDSYNESAAGGEIPTLTIDDIGNEWILVYGWFNEIGEEITQDDENKMIDAIDQAIDHWQKMVDSAKTFDPNETPDGLKLFCESGESWGADYCVLCEKFYDRNDNDCKACPLEQKYGPCDKNNIYMKMVESINWAYWIEYADKYLNQIKSLKKVKSDIANVRR